LNSKELKQARADIVQQFGDWSAHNLYLGEDVYTYDQTHPKFADQLVGHGTHLRRIVQIVSDITKQPLSQLRALDLACLEGLYGIELARHGAQVVGIEGREASIEKARFAKKVLALDNLTLTQDDVRNLSVEKYGHFDVVLCLGILYHLDAPDVFHFVERMSDVCTRVAIIDTHVGLVPNQTHTYKGREYHGWSFREHDDNASPEARLKALWASLDNEHSFWLTRPSLFNLLAASGFTSVYTCQYPVPLGQWVDRDTLVAIKGDPQALLSTPTVNGVPAPVWTEDSEVGLHPSQEHQMKSSGGGLRAFPRRIIRKGLNVIKRTRRQRTS
jgi:hypothetical protein